MRILITNDDGIDAPGIRKLAEAVVDLNEVWVIAPSAQQSSKSHSYSFTTSITIRRHDFHMDGVHAFAVDGTPTDCIKAGILKIMPEKPDLVLSGINNGYNISADIQYSATAAAALEASFLGVQAIAVSQGSIEHMDVVDAYLKSLIHECISKPLPKDTIWNINFPSCSASECNGVRRDCRISTDAFYDDTYSSEKNEDGSYTLRIMPGRHWNATEGTDLAAVTDNFISMGTVHNLQ